MLQINKKFSLIRLGQYCNFFKILQLIIIYV